MSGPNETDGPAFDPAVLQRFRLDDRVVVVTGAGRGIGRGVALACAEAGADVLLVARSADQLAEVADGVRALGRRAEAMAFDVNDLERLAAVPARAAEVFGRLDVVVNNAGGAPPRPLLQTSSRAFEAALHFNVTTAFELTRAATPLLLEGDGGSVVNVSSAAGRFANRGFVAYGTAKAAMSALTRQLAADLAPRVRVNAVEVGATSTSALETVLTDDSVRRALEQSAPLRRIGEVVDIAAAVLFLASPAAAFISGAILPVDGGLTGPGLPLGLPDLEPGAM